MRLTRCNNIFDSDLCSCVSLQREDLFLTEFLRVFYFFIFSHFILYCQFSSLFHEDSLFEAVIAVREINGKKI
jgi:hypothetical protein